MSTMPRMAGTAGQPTLDGRSARPESVVRKLTKALSQLSWGCGTELLVFLMAALLLRLYVVWQNPLITKDGLIYLGIARTIDHGMWLDLVGDWFLFNPYPAAIAWLARQGVEFELAGQLINAVSSTLAIIPIYLWCGSAFDRRIAQLAVLTYAFHPIMVRISGQVLREGLYWNLMCWAIYLYWGAARQHSWWRFLFAGLLTTAAALTRMEGAIVFMLGGLWTFSFTWKQSSVQKTLDASFRSATTTQACDSPLKNWTLSACRWLGSLAMFPVTLILLNVLLVPAGHGWQGTGRWLHFAVQMVAGVETRTVQRPPPVRMQQLVELERQRQESSEQPVDNLRDLAKSLPVWNSLGEPDIAQLRMQRFLILAQDQQRFIFFGRFLNECIDGLLFPCVICCLWGLYYGRKTIWQPARDWPLAIHACLLTGLLLFHLSKEFILEPRYMFCLIPFVFPWSGVGAREMYRQLGEWFDRRPTWSASWRPSAGALIVGLMLWACGKLWIGVDEHSKLAQREIGVRLHQLCPYRMKIAGPESLKRIGHYADADYFIIPKGDPKSVANWLSQLPLDFVVLTSEETQSISPQQLTAEESFGRYRQLFETEMKRHVVRVFCVRPPIHQVGS